MAPCKAMDAVSAMNVAPIEVAVLKDVFSPSEMTVLKDGLGNIALDFVPQDPGMRLEPGQYVWLSIQMGPLYPQEPATYDFVAPFLSVDEVSKVEIIMGKFKFFAQIPSSSVTISGYFFQ